MSRIRNAIKQDKMFINNAIVKVPRSTFSRNQKHSTTFNAGKLVPISVMEVIPGDSFDINLSSVIRTTSPFIKAPMDELRADFYAFFVPNRIVFSKFTDMIANYHDDPDWTLETDIITPEIWWNTSGSHTQADFIDSIADHMGIPPLAENALAGASTRKKVNQIPFRGYCKIWNEWFRDENLQNTIFIDKDNYTDTHFAPTSESYITGAINGGQMLPLNKIKDYFTSALPAPQAGPAPTIAVGGRVPVDFSAATGSIPITYGKNGTDLKHVYAGYNYQDNSAEILLGRYVGDDERSVPVHNYTFVSGTPRQAPVIDDIIGSTSTDSNRGSLYGIIGPNVASGARADIENVFADLGHTSGISVNDLRYLIQIQQIRETDARYGRRYKEYLLGHFGVVSADARLQIPEFLGHTGYDLNINQTVQTSGDIINEESNATYSTPQSNISSYSLTSGNGRICNKSFTEHGYIIIVGGVRIKHRTYSQGINRMWLRNSRYDYYDPCFSNIGEQPVYDRELYLDRQTIDSVFGYQEAWADYRYLPNITSGYQRPQISQTLAYWNFADNYTSQPTLSGEWIQEDITPIDRCLAIPSQTVPQFTADFYIKNRAIRPMPVHSIPGLIDHSGKIII